jgi:uncharacterized membrane protein
MSDAFSFTFGFYGLLLGLAVAEVASGFSRAYDERNTRRIGIITPLFAILLLLDLITFWMNAWAFRKLADVNYLTAYAVAIVALLYYFGATQIFPKSSDKHTLDDHIMESRRVVMFCVLVSNLMSQIPNAFLAFTTPWPLSQTALWAALNLIYYILLIVAALAKTKKVAGCFVAVAILYVIGATVLLE